MGFLRYVVISIKPLSCILCNFLSCTEVLVSTDTIEIELFRKNDGDNWRIINFQVGDIVELKSINFTFPIEQIYEEIVFE